MADKKQKNFQKIVMATDGDVKTYVKPGYKTSEFWIVVLGIISSNAAAISHLLDPRWASIATAIGTFAYAISRGLAKR